MSKKLFNDFLKFTGVASKSDSNQTNVSPSSNTPSSISDEAVSSAESYIGIEMFFR